MLAFGEIVEMMRKDRRVSSSLRRHEAGSVARTLGRVVGGVRLRFGGEG
jgi:hypothetical protein